MFQNTKLNKQSFYVFDTVVVVYLGFMGFGQS
jgi:hypothetical protein